MWHAPQPAMRGAATAAKALAVAAAATVAAVALTLAAAGPALAATAVQFQSTAPAASASVKVKYYVVAPPSHGSVPTLYSIAAATLGNGSLFMEIFNLNKGRLSQTASGWKIRILSSRAGYSCSPRTRLGLACISARCPPRRKPPHGWYTGTHSVARPRPPHAPRRRARATGPARSWRP